MEGSQAGLAGGGDAGQAQGQEAAQQQGPDIGQLAQNLETLQSGQEELRQFLMSAPWQQQVQEVQEAEPELDLSYLMPQQEMDGSELAQRLGQTITEATDQRLQSQFDQRVNPMMQAVDDIRMRLDVQDLVQEFPEMAEPEVAQRVAGQGGLAEQLASQLGQPELASKPQFWRLAYMAARAAEIANEEGAETPRAAHLEGGGGAMPGSSQVDLGEQIVKADAGRRVLPFG
jgi:hypothetical protein